MTEATTEFAWRFGGPLSTLPPGAAWAVWCAAAAACLVAVHASYRSARMAALTPAQRRNFSLLRGAVAVLLLICLANPTLTQTERLTEPSARRLAVVVDGSSSMRADDHRGSSRLEGALKIWHALAPRAAQAHEDISHFALADSLERRPDLASATRPSQPQETRLFDGLNQLVSRGDAGRRFDSIVCLTDGLDTAGGSASALIDQAQAHGVPLYFIPGDNRAPASHSLAIEEVSVPPVVDSAMRFPVRVLLSATAPHDSEAHVVLRQDGVEIERARVPFQSGSHRVAWTHEVHAPNESDRPVSRLDVEVELGSIRREAASSVLVQSRTDFSVLLFQGALDWGARFIAQALRSDRDIELAIAWDADSFRPPRSASSRPATPPAKPAFPDSVAELRTHHLIILANVFAHQLSSAQQGALVEFCKQGGGVLFLVPDSREARGFSGSELERMLPVVFGAPPPQDARERAAELFRQDIMAAGGSHALMESQFAEATTARQAAMPLFPFELVNANASDVQRMFQRPGGGDPIVPHLASHAHITRTKPGAEILATAPIPGTGAAPVVLAVQRFGAGRSAVLASDSLWRWRLALPSQSTDADLFWQHLVRWLAGRSQTFAGPQLLAQPEGAINRPVRVVAVTADHTTPPELQAVQGERRLALSLQSTEKPGTWRGSFVPPSAGWWDLAVSDLNESPARTHVRVWEAAHVAELSGRPPDRQVLADVAAATGGDVLTGSQAPAAWDAFQQEPEPLSHPPLVVARQHRPLWNASWTLFGILALYGIELVLRRRAQLI